MNASLSNGQPVNQSLIPSAFTLRTFIPLAAASGNAKRIPVDFDDHVMAARAAQTSPRVKERPQSEGNTIKCNFHRASIPLAKAVVSSRRLIPNSLLIAKLASAPLFQEFLRAFEDATGLPLTLRGVEDWQLAHRGSRRQNGFCALMSQANRSCAACLQVQQNACDGARIAPGTMSCSFGIIETAVGVKIGSETVAFLQTGQVLFKPASPRQTRRALDQIKLWGLDLDPAEVAERYHETPVVRRAEYQARVRLLELFADQLGALANQIVLQQQTAEPGQITRARHYIEEHYQEDFSLLLVARQVGMSRFYFCKQFKKVTGVNFTQYVSRVRVEQAKRLLLNLHYRVSEIAFEAGFQSLTHFNRIFKNIAGYSPTEFRRHLPGV